MEWWESELPAICSFITDHRCRHSLFHKEGFCSVTVAVHNATSTSLYYPCMTVHTNVPPSVDFQACLPTAKSDPPLKVYLDRCFFIMQSMN